MNHEFYHHGILGQKWGVRRFQNEDGSLTPAGRDRYYTNPDKRIRTTSDGSKIVPVGFMFNRVGKSTKDVNRSGATYVSYGKDCVSRYIKYMGPTPLNRLLKTSAEAVQHIRVKQNLKIPSDETIAKETAEFLLSDENHLKNFNKSLGSAFVTGEIDKDVTRDDVKRALSDPRSKDAQRLAYAVSTTLADPQFVDEAKSLYQRFRKQGYDALPDLADRLSGTSKTATIVINPEKVEITSITPITKDVMKKAKKYVRSLEKLKVSDIIT